MKEYSKCEKSRWDEAQKWELQEWIVAPNDMDDWNQWWFQKFDGYNTLKQNYDNYIEVGCGPFAHNTRLIKQKTKLNKVTLSDPLLNEYILNGKSVKELINENTGVLTVPLEEIQVEEKYDLVVCINVLDHVYDANQCFDAIYNMLSFDGEFIFGQDLTNQYDIENCDGILGDKGHPILIDEDFCNPYLAKYDIKKRKIIARNEGRNPSAHYATLIFHGVKK